MTTSVAFSSLAILNMLRDSLGEFPYTLLRAIDSLVSMKRISDYLDKEDVHDYLNEDTRIAFIDASLSHTSGENILKNISVDIPNGKLTVIAGPTGCGKSSFLKALLGDLKLESGGVTFPKSLSLAYVSQTAWIQNDTIRNNICYGKNYEQQWYHDVIFYCSLEKDMEIFPAGDSTLIGEKGINLSGGQKQRISLARALYSRPDVLLLDGTFISIYFRSTLCC